MLKCSVACVKGIGVFSWPELLKNSRHYLGDIKNRGRILVQVTIYRRLLIGRDGHLDQSEAYDITRLVRAYGPRCQEIPENIVRLDSH